MTAALAPPKPVTFLDSLSDWAENAWADIDELITELIAPPGNQLTYFEMPGPEHATHTGWFILGDRTWVPIDDLPPAAVIDVESRQHISGYWEAFLAIAADGSNWYLWRGASQVIPVSPGSVLVGQNVCEHDSQFFSCEYELLGPDRCIYIDTRSLLKLYRGIAPEMQAQFQKHSKAVAAGKPAPDWMTVVTECDLEAAALNVLGLQMNKSVKGEHESGIEAPETVVEYCAQDVWFTLLLLRQLYPLIRSVYMPSAVSWWAMFGAMTGLRYPVDDWVQFTGGLREAYDTSLKIAKGKRDKIEQDLIDWGRVYLRVFEEGYEIDGMMPLRLNPAGDVFRKPYSAIWNNRSITDGVGPELSCNYDPGFNGYSIVEIDLDFGRFKFSAAEAKVLAGQPGLSSPLLKVRCPESVERFGKTKLSQKWLQTSIEVDAFHIFLCAVDRAIEAGEMDAFLVLPRLEGCQFAVKGGKTEADCFRKILEGIREKVENIVEMEVIAF
ncbi:MAG: hypothetical protein AAF329_01970 [Cyanobacteria bacterium P01_A01_bin.17]